MTEDVARRKVLDALEVRNPSVTHVGGDRIHIEMRATDFDQITEAAARTEELEANYQDDLSDSWHEGFAHGKDDGRRQTIKEIKRLAERAS